MTGTARSSDQDPISTPRESKVRTSAIAAAVLAAVVLSFGASAASAEQRFLKVGSMTCRLSPTVGLIVGSRQRLRCRFVGSRDGRVERYLGTVTRFGLDVGVTAGGVMVWTVLARTRTTARGLLAGHYVGASADVSLGPGVGAKALIGGSRRTTMLQPISVSGRVGINLALGVTGLTLRYAG
jgi:hypothetical protein